LNYSNFSQKNLDFFYKTTLAVGYLLLPLGTSTVERSFSTLNRIACAEGNSLNSDHQDYLMRISAEGPQALSAELLDSAISQWCKTARRV